MIITRIISFIVISLISSPSFAHVKWFVEFDIADAPKSFFDLLSLLFIGLFILATLGVFIGSYIDGVEKLDSLFYPCLKQNTKTYH